MWILSKKDAILISRSSSHPVFLLITLNLDGEKYYIIGLSQATNNSEWFWTGKRDSDLNSERSLQQQCRKWIWRAGWRENRCLDSCKGSENGEEGGAGPHSWMTEIWWPADLKNDKGQEAASQVFSWAPEGWESHSLCSFQVLFTHFLQGEPRQLPMSPDALSRALSAICTRPS